MISLIHMLYFEPLLQELWYGHPWYPCWNISLKRGGYYTYSGPWRSPTLLWTSCTPNNHFSWYYAFLEEWAWWDGVEVDFSPHNLCIGFYSNGDLVHPLCKSTGCLWGYNVWTETYTCFTAYTWCLSTLSVCQVAPFLQWQITLRLHHLGCWNFMQIWRLLTCALHQW